MISAPSRPAGSNTISDVEIKNCLTSAGRTATINAVRLSGHSRGAAGLAATLAGRTVTPALIEHVTVLDASDFAASLTRGLAASGVPASRVTAYNVVFGALPAAAQNVQLSFNCVRSIGYARLITDGLATGRTPAPLPTGIAARVGALTLPPRGNNILGFNNSSAPRPTWSHFSPQIYSHHLFVAEIGYEMFS